MMKFRPATFHDIPTVIEIIDQGKAYFRSHGIEQWQREYPNATSIEKDIQDKTGYVLAEEKRKIIAYVSASFIPDDHYQYISGKWLTTGNNFCTVHRLAIDNHKKGSGVAAVLLKHIENICIEKKVPSIKVDTHVDNLPMKRFLEKNGFIFCGTVINTWDEERIVYEKILAI